MRKKEYIITRSRKGGVSEALKKTPGLQLRRAHDSKNTKKSERETDRHKREGDHGN